MNRIVWYASALLVTLHGAAFLAQQPAAQPPNKDGELTFEKAVLPIFQAKCLSCHGENKQRASLDLRTKASVLYGGESGAGLKPGAPAESLLWNKIRLDEMPPGTTKLTAMEKETIQRWIKTGAPAVDNSSLPPALAVQVPDEDRQFWSFQKPVRPPVPAVHAQQRVRNPIDAFILAALEKKGLTLSPEVDRLSLLRRVTYDLTGLPPAPEEIEAFLADASPNAYEKAVDRLLASHRYGERWGRHWLDLAGYADSEGLLRGDFIRSSAWRYRDYVIRAFNQDKPYDRFLQEQIAGDELVDYLAKFQQGLELDRKERRLEDGSRWFEFFPKAREVPTVPEEVAEARCHRLFALRSGCEPGQFPAGSQKHHPRILLPDDR